MNLEPQSYLMRCACGATFRLNLIPELAKEFKPTPDGDALQGTCAQCGDVERADAEVKAANARHTQREEFNRRAWETACPFEYRTREEGGATDKARLALAKRVTSADDGSPLAVNWKDLLAQEEKPNRPVLLLIGPSGSCKTRIGWRVTRAAWDAEVTAPESDRRGVCAFTSWAFQAHVQDAAGRFISGQAMGALVQARIVFIDDLGKVEWTDTVAATFFELLEQRISRRAQTVITTEFQGDQLENWFSGARSRVLAGAAAGSPG
ncbi:MAG: ATP-binding protein, partial [Verrucomicrobia bacterium]|nr:ATP-binding protein [Verrucomicrobiota bacterium]